jgi:histidyl-tRNA synthetase
MVKTENPKGFKDYLGKDALKREKILKIIKDNFKSFGYEPAETPIIEYEEFVKGDNSNDEAVRDVFKLEDRGKRKLALRYEFTFQLKRIAKKQKLPYKRFQIGYNFRDEPIREGRTRQFIQADADIIGSSLKDEAENFSLIQKVFQELKTPIKIYVNNRKLMNEILVDEKIEEKDRKNVIREIDKLDKFSKKEVADNLKKYSAEKILKVFEKDESYFEKYNYYKEIKELKKYCKLFNVEIEFRPFLARGFSYYNGTVFEVWSKNLNVSILGGGSYLIGDVQATGISFGLEPIFLVSDIKGDPIEYLIISLGQDKESIKITKRLREKSANVQLLMDKTLKKALDYANSKEIPKVIIVGEKEVKEKKYKIKDMKTGKESKLNF